MEIGTHPFSSNSQSNQQGNNMFKKKAFLIKSLFAFFVFSAAVLYFTVNYRNSSPQKKQGLQVYITRHAETVGNVTRNYSEENQCTFSPKGLGQIDNINEKFKDYHFDYIFVSPTYRTQHTILPYLKAHNMIGEIWPEIEEGCFDITPETKPSKIIPRGEEIELFDNSLFRLRTPSDGFRYSPENASEGLAQFIKARNYILEYSSTGKSILLVCHYCTGSRLMEILLGLDQKGRFGPQNAAMTLLKEQPDGSFKMILYNDKPFAQIAQKFFWKQDINGKGEVSMHLFPELFLNNLAEEHSLRWKAYDEENNLIAEGDKGFTAENRDDKALTSIRIPAANIKPGVICSLDSEIFSKGKPVYRWNENFLVPTYKNLAGKWLIKKGDNPERAAKDYQESGWESIEVPGSWERSALPAYDGIAWYRVHFNISNEDLIKWEGKEIAVAMGAIDDADVTYLNGVKIGEMGKFPPEEITAWDKPRVYKIDRDLLQDNNVLAVKVCDWMGSGGIWRLPVAIGPIEEMVSTLTISGIQ